MDFIGAITAATKAYEGLKLLKGLEKNFNEASFKATIAEITSNLADVKMALTEARAEAAEKDAEIDRLRKEFAFLIDNTIMSKGFRYEKSSQGRPQGMPFCPRCEKVDGRLMRLAKTTSKEGFKAICPQCKAEFGNQHGYGYDSTPPSSLSDSGCF
jgi:hypothetical protein